VVENAEEGGEPKGTDFPFGLDTAKKEQETNAEKENGTHA
jgi:hypothetical protein